MSSKVLKERLESLLFADIANFWLDLYRQKYKQLVNELSEWELIKNQPDDNDEDDWLLLQAIAFLTHKIDKLQNQLTKLDGDHRRFVERLSHAELKAERQFHILDYAKTLGASELQLQKDQDAFQRWFDEGAMINRYQDKTSELEQSLKFLIGKLGDLTNRYLRNHQNDMAQSWLRLDLEGFFLNLLEKTDNEATRNSLFRALANQVNLLNEYVEDPEFNADLVENLLQSLEKPTTPHAAKVDILEILINLRPTFTRYFMRSHIDLDVDKNGKVDRQQLFLITSFAKIISKQFSLNEANRKLIFLLAKHAYPRVRQSVIEQCSVLPWSCVTDLLNERMQLENSPAVRLTLIKQLSDPRFSEQQLGFKLWQQLLEETDNFAEQRLLLELTPRIMFNLQVDNDNHDYTQDIFKAFINVLNRQLEEKTNLAVKRIISRVREQLVSFMHQQQVAQLEVSLSSDTSIDCKEVDEDLLGRLLSKQAQHYEAFNVNLKKKSWQVQLGYKRGFRIWRLWHEFKNPSTGKRQSYNHLQARKPSAFMHVPSCTVAEISQTEVPGEPRFDEHQFSSRPHLPLLDFLLSTLSQDNLKAPAKSYTPDGILIISPPTSLFKRLYAYCWISLNYEKLNELRNGTEVEQQHYLENIRSKGFTLDFQPYGMLFDVAFPVESGIANLYKKLAITPFIFNIGSSFKEYAYSIYQNSIGQLIFFVISFIAYFWARHIKISRQIQSDRALIPVSIGGWGTRGKSGTERLKAALFSSLCLKVVSKTTGCEATMIYARASGEQFEIPLFRPFDKASIWEQGDVLHFAKNVKADVFLWECMGLTPRYVRILRNWMKDNFSTITNAYPDHEDILGPTGIDVANETSNFIGDNSLVFTSEQNMAPILDVNAKQKNSSLIQVHWADGLQITDDIRSLYPYQEHPANIALVCKMAQHIGLSKDYVYKETSARIIPDIGVLQHFEKAKVGKVEQSFINSMSANERLATLENWQRLGIYDLNDNPKKQVIALINNRNDRVARSKVFADILSHDLRFDKIVVIGTNVDGFYSYFINALIERLDKIIANNDLEEFNKLLSQFNFLTEEQLIARLSDAYDLTLANKLIKLNGDSLKKSNINALLKDATGNSNEAEASAILQNLFVYQQRQTLELLKQDIVNNSEKLKEVIVNTIKSNVVLHENSSLSADELTRSIAQLGLVNNHQVIVGMQNIKGAGLNYVYAWQQWQRINHTLEHLFDQQCTAKEFRTALTNLNMIVSFNRLEVATLKQHLSTLKKMHLAQNEFCQAEITNLLEKLEAYSSEDNVEKQQALPIQYLNQVVESFLDAGAAVKRKKRANQIYKDIADQRITLEKAIKILGKLSRNQKSGWFANKSKPN
ncbi:MAG: poly-gamma-glutamate synthase PgsB [Pseudoalteromonas sp.]|uniref:poly-gamma-glutamate synthase PgsB n=1 Tax=Pseudoalteromonas sp. TaxID=53249 RepID=UPI0025CFA50D|nr:poly-gamma-glutamate synthase PgsB [Pseudoalteromonas sp.]MCH2085631.1 poly-gamma-glutamate synthase PgsB [Pseudoalteromonas sp.]